MKKKYYACNHSGLAIRNIAEVNCNATGNQVTATDYNYSSGKIKTLSNEGCECFLYDNTEISKSEFENYMNAFLEMYPQNNKKDKKKLPIQIIMKEAEETSAQKNPITSYQLYGGGVQISGYSKKSRKDLSRFIESHGRKYGFRILDSDGITKGFVTAELLNTLSYHLQDI